MANSAVDMSSISNVTANSNNDNNNCNSNYSNNNNVNNNDNNNENGNNCSNASHLGVVPSISCTLVSPEFSPFFLTLSQCPGRSATCRTVMFFSLGPLMTLELSRLEFFFNHLPLHQSVSHKHNQVSMACKS